MISFRAFAVLAAACLAVVVGACATDASKPDKASSGSATAGDGTSGRVSADARKSSVSVTKPSDGRIYLDFDSSNLDSADIKVLDRWSAYLLANPGVSIILEGHCDERGTPEYNISLGEQRAAAARGHLLATGVGAEQISVVSHGEERPVATGHTEKAWSKNRRVEILQQ